MLIAITNLHFRGINENKWLLLWCGGGGRCVIIILICWLWLSGRLPADLAHLVNETLRSRDRERKRDEKKRWGRGNRDKGKKLGERVMEKKKGKRKAGKRERDIWRQWEPHCYQCLMKRWANEVLAVYTSSSIHLLLPSPSVLPSPTWQHLDSQSGCSAHQWSRSEIPFSPRGF